MRSVIRVLLRCFLLAASLSPAHVLAQDTTRVDIEGTVIDSRSGLPIESVEVSLADLGVVTLTDSMGAFSLPKLALGTYNLALQKSGYETAEGPLQVLRPGSMVIRLDPLSTSGDPGSSRIQGTVKDLDSEKPLEGALVSIEGVQLNQLTDAGGRFVLTDIPAGPRRIVVSFLGYSNRMDSIMVPPATILTLDLALAVEPIELAPIEISVEARNLDLEISGFYQRREETSGYFITRERIEERAPLYTTDLFRGMAGVKVIGGLGMGTQKAVLLTGSRSLSFGGRRCYPAVWMDGQMVHQGTAGPLQQGPAFLDQLIHPDDIAGVEVYNSPASMPIQYNLHGGCGVIVIWTRYGR